MRLIATFLVLIIAFLLLLPVFWLVIGSFRSTMSFNAVPPELIPKSYSLRSYEMLLDYPILRWVFNSVWTATLGSLLVVVFNVYIGYVFAKKAVPFKEWIFWGFMASLMIPGPVTFIPGFVLMKNLGLINRLAVLIIPGIFSVSWMFFFRQFIAKIPNELFDMADIDGAGEALKIRRILIPLCIPAMASVMVFTWIGKWSDYVAPLLYIIDRAKYTLPVGIVQVLFDDAVRRREGSFIPNYGLTMAGSTITLVPMVLIFIVLHRYFVKGIFEGSVKG